MTFSKNMSESLIYETLIDRLDPYVEMTTAVGKIFGGFLRSKSKK